MDITISTIRRGKKAARQLTGTASLDGAASPGTVSLDIKALADATPPERERVIDFVRVAAISVVVLWHWVFSITQWNRSGQLIMPNLISHVPALWLATWLLQIMPLFFVVGGYSNLASWQGVQRRGQGTYSFWKRRLRRLLRPAVALAAVWGLVDLLAVTAGGQSTNVLHWGMVTFVPLWFLGTYAGVILLVPVTARLHERFGLAVPAVLASAMLIAGRGYVTTLLVWIFAHQLGYFWRDGRTSRKGRSTELKAALALSGFGIASLALLTTIGGYPQSMVATAGEHFSNMFPTTICIAALSVLQFGLILLFRPALDRWLQRRHIWRLVVAANAIAMTIFCWHMTALIIVIISFGALGGHLLSEPTSAWWIWRPFWLIAPGVVLVGLVAIFSRIERS